MNVIFSLIREYTILFNVIARFQGLDLGAYLYKNPPCTLIKDPRESNKIDYSLIFCLFILIFVSLLYNIILQY